MPISEGGQFTPDNRIVSPGVFSRENDLSGIAQGVADIGAVIVAPFAKGPGFSPTLVTSISDLNSQFGIADGTLYGPYTAMQYLEQKGFVTVCRVGALTGYEQSYPLVVWAEEGNWTRGQDAGWLDPLLSDISVNTASAFFTTFVTASAGGGLISYSGSIVFTSASAQLVLDSTPGTGTEISASNPSGSIYYFGTTINGFISGVMTFSGSLAGNFTASADIINAIIGSGSMSGTVIADGFPVWTSTQEPFTSYFDETHFDGEMVTINQSLDLCNRPIFDLYGLLSGSFGAYDGGFIPGSNNYFDVCTNKWVQSGSSYKVLAVLADTLNAPPNTQLQSPGFLGSTNSYNPGPSGSIVVGVEFDLSLSQSFDGGYGIYNYSLDANVPKYITNVFGNNPQAGNPATYAEGTKIEAAYLYSIFEDDITVIVQNPSRWRVHGDAMPSGSWTGQPLNFTDKYSLDVINGDSQFSLTNAYTPFVLSQQISPFNGGTPHRFPLFQLATMADGTYTNTSWKIEISNVKLAGTVAGSDWGTFTLSVRDFNDTDKKVSILEQFNNLTLDPSSPQFIARAIGDRYNFIRFDGKIIEFGTYTNNSNYIRVVMANNPYPVTAVPYGFDNYSVPVNGAIGNWCNPLAYTKASVYGLFPGRYPSGIDFNGPPAGADAELFALYPTASVGEEHWKDNLQVLCSSTSGRIGR